jgi:hypothetical protein
VRIILGQEDDYGEIGRVPVFLEVEIEGDGSVERRLDRLDFAENADHGGVLKGVAGVFAGSDVGLEIFFRDGDPEFEVSAGRKRRGVFRADGEGFFVDCAGGGRAHAEKSFWDGSGPTNMIVGVLGAAADELYAAVNYHLGSVNTAVLNSFRVLLLAFGKLRRREAIGPTQVVPIIDMFFESKDFDAVERLNVAEFFQKGVGSRATGAAFGSEEFDDDGLLGWGRVLRGGGGVSGIVDGDGNDRENGGQERESE